MLLRIRVQGFKNLRDVDIRFGPMTCFVGPNGVGKSNVFDAVQFLRHLAEDEIHKAADAIRKPTDGAFSPLDLVANRDPETTMRFSADMLVPLEAEDDFGEKVTPTSSLLNYSVALRFSSEEGRLVLVEEGLRHYRKSEARGVIGFPHSETFRESIVVAKRFGPAFLSTAEVEGRPRIQLHADGGSRGRPTAPGSSPRTILGGTGTKDYPTVVAARREMSSWHSVHLEPSALRTPDRFGDVAPVDEYGRHIAATLRRLGRSRWRVPGSAARSDAVGEGIQDVCAEAANQLARLVDGVRAIRVREDEARQHYVVEVRFRDSDLWHPPRALSEGTLRYLALVAMQLDTRSSRVLCIEEPENGIEPSGIPSLLHLLRDYAVDAEEAVDGDNPLRQVVLNSHSRDVVRELSARDVLFMQTERTSAGTFAQVRAVDFEEVWRDEAPRVSLDHFKRWVGDLPRGQGNLAWND